jgi:hypothetical protein
MPSFNVDLELLRRFEMGLDPRHPERSEIPTRVLGYGEISTVLEIGTPTERHLAYKRMPLFRTEHEADSYQALYREYVHVLQERIGLQIAAGDVVRVVDEQQCRVVVYIVQEKFPSAAIGHRAIHCVSPGDVRKLVLAVLKETAKVFDFNRHHKGELEIGLDGQISNWAIVNFDPQAPDLDDELDLVYFDTSTPFVRKNGVEQLDPELFLRSAPSFLVWVLRLLFLEDVMTRYYDFREVTIDIVANFYKEQRPDLVPDLVDAINGSFSSDVRDSGFEPITVAEVRSYYREDAWIWRLYLAFRKVDRALHRLLGRHYAYILPETIKR